MREAEFLEQLKLQELRITFLGRVRLMKESFIIIHAIVYLSCWPILGVGLVRRPGKCHEDNDPSTENIGM
jgi:hypothetical protein